MNHAGFLDAESRRDLIDLGRDGSAAYRLARRANALVLLDDGLGCRKVTWVLLLDEDTVRTWYRLYKDEGIEGMADFGHDGSACRLGDAQQDQLKSWLAEALPGTSGEVGAWIESECDVTYESRFGLIALLHRLDMEHRKPKLVLSKLDPKKQAAFIKCYENLSNQIGDYEAVHPAHAVRPVGCWAPKRYAARGTVNQRPAASERGAIDLKSGRTIMIEATVDPVSAIMLLMAIDTTYGGKNRYICLWIMPATDTSGLY